LITQNIISKISADHFVEKFRDVNKQSNWFPVAPHLAGGDAFNHMIDRLIRRVRPHIEQSDSTFTGLPIQANLAQSYFTSGRPTTLIKIERRKNRRRWSVRLDWPRCKQNSRRFIDPAPAMFCTMTLGLPGMYLGQELREMARVQIIDIARLSAGDDG
jgi:hypothetical protein